MVVILLARFDVKHSFNIPTLPVARLGPTIDNGVVTDCPFRQELDSVIWQVGMMRPDIAGAAHDSSLTQFV